jgi:2-iminobutanoate/2-iminopropanoate deaminase
MSRDAVSSPEAPAAVGPYAHAVRAAGLLFLSGQTPIDPATGTLVEGDVGVQTERVPANLAAMNAVYARTFTQPFPARTTVAVAGLPLGARVEIEAVALLG